jgi:hypothetical protein
MLSENYKMRSPKAVISLITPVIKSCEGFYKTGSGLRGTIV